MSAEDLEKYETEQELALYREYRDVVGLFSHVVETERRFYLCNEVDVLVRGEGAEVFFDVRMSDAWVWDVYRPARFVKTRARHHLQGRQRGGASGPRDGTARLSGGDGDTGRYEGHRSTCVPRA